jgi:hypothetical protein
MIPINLLSLAKISVFLAALLIWTSANAQVTCIQTYLELEKPALGFAPSEVEGIVTQIATAIGLTPAGITVVPCDGITQVQSFYFVRPGVPQGEYILYDPRWVRQVVGPDLSDEAVILFGHELGHILLRHWTANAGLSRLKKETDADHFAGCAAGAMGVKWDAVQNLLKRIRLDVETDYPSAQHSIQAAREGFERCEREPHRQKAREIRRRVEEEAQRVDESTIRAALRSTIGDIPLTTLTDGTKLFEVRVWLDLPNQLTSYIDSVKYFRNHNTFPQPVVRSRGPPDFMSSWAGWGCPHESSAIVKLKSGPTIVAPFDMCRVWDETARRRTRY